MHVLEEVEMPPRLLLGVVDPVACAFAFGAHEPVPGRKIHEQIEPTLLD
jgi:hypothetical protein